MKRIFWNITLASTLTLIAYIFLFFIWGAIFNAFDNQMLKSFLIAFMTTVVFGVFLLYTSKIRKSAGEDEVKSDYMDRKYISYVEDFKLIIKRESKVIITISAIVFLTFALNGIDTLVFGKKIISHVTFFFAPMSFFSSYFSISLFGYLISAVLDCAVYLFLLLIFRRRKYKYWNKEQK